MNKIYFYHLLLLVVFSLRSAAQSNMPTVVVQSGFSNEISTHFMFSHLNNYLYGYNDYGEFILWEIRSGKQVKKIAPLASEMPTINYVPVTSFSNNEKFILIPDYPKGNYFLYDVQEDKIVKTFQPPFSEEKYINAIFSEDGSKILFCTAIQGSSPACRIQIKDLRGELYSSLILQIPQLPDTKFIITDLMMNRANKILSTFAPITAMTVSPDLKEVWFATYRGNLFYLNIANAPKDRELTEADYKTIVLSTRLTIPFDVSLSGNTILAKEPSSYIKQKDGTFIKRDSIYVIDRYTNTLSKVMESKFKLFTADKRSNSITTLPLTTGQRMNTYFLLKDIALDRFTIECRDIMSGNELFRYSSGDPFHYDTKGLYKGGQFNGGYIVAISDDQSLVAECTRDLIIHNISKKNIKTYFPLSRGNLKLNCPLFLDSARLFVPKVYNDGFVVNLRSGQTDRLTRELNCQDTIRNGANTFFQVDATASLGLQNSCLSQDRKQLAVINYMPDDLCNSFRNKTIQLYETDQLIRTAQYRFSDPEYSYYFNIVSGEPNKFLVNYKLVTFSDSVSCQIKPLHIIQKKDTFLAVNPLYLPKYNCIFSILGTRVKPGNPNLFFAQFDLMGKLIRSVKYERQKSKLAFQTVIYEAQLSPDSSQLLFGLHDGTVGIFDLNDWKVKNLFEHGSVFKIKHIKGVEHTIVTAGCFLDNDRFVTNGSDGKLNLWSIHENKLLSIINKEPILTYGLTVSPDKRYIIGTDMDKSILFINIETGIVDLRFMAFDYDSYAFVNKDGYYMSNKKSSNNLSFFFHGKSYEFSQFDLYLNRPDKVLEGTGYMLESTINSFRDAYRKRLELSGFKAIPQNLPLNDIPEITLNGLPDAMKETSSGTLSFTVSAINRKRQLERLMVNVNGVPLYGTKGMVIKQSILDLQTISVTVPLSYGINRIEVSVVNNQGAESLREYFSLSRIGTPVKPNLYLIAIGSGSFLQKGKNLTFPGKDAQDVIDLFKSQDANYSKVITYKLVNTEVTRTAVLGLKEKLKGTQPDDQVILFYAGHGLLTKTLDYYLSTYNTDFANPAMQALPYSLLESLLDSIPARNKIMFLDACHSGEVLKEDVREQIQSRTVTNGKIFRGSDKPAIAAVNTNLANAFILMQSLFYDLRRSSGTSVIAAAAATEYAEEGDQWKNGAFTYCLKKGLQEKQADLDKDGKIYVSELLEFVQKNVPKLTNNGQRPLSRAENIITNTLIWH